MKKNMNFNDLLPINSVPHMARLAVILISISEKKINKKILLSIVTMNR